MFTGEKYYLVKNVWGKMLCTINMDSTNTFLSNVSIFQAGIENQLHFYRKYVLCQRTKNEKFEMNFMSIDNQFYEF